MGVGVGGAGAAGAPRSSSSTRTLAAAMSTIVEKIKDIESNLENYKNIYVSRPKKKRETPKKWRIVCVNLRKARVA